MVYNPRNLNLNGFSYNCPLNNCGRVFLSIFAYIDHLACPGHQHEELECPECDEEFEGLGYLTWHLFLKHVRFLKISYFILLKGQVLQLRRDAMCVSK